MELLIRQMVSKLSINQTFSTFCPISLINSERWSFFIMMILDMKLLWLTCILSLSAISVKRLPMWFLLYIITPTTVHVSLSVSIQLAITGL